MALPRLIHPINVVINPISKTSTVYDRDTREPLGTAVRSAAITVSAQVKWRVPGEPQWEAVGPVEDVRGYLLMRYLDITALSYTPKRGDEITAIGHVQTLLYITQLDDMAHYPDQNGAALRRAYFGDRRPATSAPTM